MFLYLLILILLIFLFFFRDYFYSLITFLSLRLEGREPDFQILNSLRDDLIHERKKKIASLEMILSTWEKSESISTHINYFRDLIGQLKLILQDQRRNLLMISSNPFLWIKMNKLITDVVKRLKHLEKNSGKIPGIRETLENFSEGIERELDKATQKFTFSLNEVIREAVKIVRTEKDSVLEEKGVSIEESYEVIGDRFRLSYSCYKDWQKLISNLIRNGVEAVEQNLIAPSCKLPAGVRIEVRGTREEVTVEVEDNGVGMDEKTRESFYKRGFSRGKEQGLGLGITEETIEFIKRYGDWSLESKINEGTRIKIKIEKEKAKEQDLTVEGSKTFVIKLKSRRTLVTISGILILIIGSGLYFQFNKYARFWVDWNPDTWKIAEDDSTVVIAKNRKGELLWSKKFKTKVSPYYQPVSDLDGDGMNELVLGILTDREKSGYITCVDYKKRKLWRFDVGCPGIYAGCEIYTPVEINVEDLNNDGQKEIIVESICKTWYKGEFVGRYPEHVVVLNNKGKVEGEYWHSGNFSFQFAEDIDKDGEREMFFTGVNNDMSSSPIIVVLDRRNMNGQSPPYRANGMSPPDSAKEEFYVRIRPIEILVKTQIRYPMARIEPAGETDLYTIWVSDGIDSSGEYFHRLYYLDHSFKTKSLVALSASYEEEWKKLIKQGYVDYDISDSLRSEWSKLQIWKNGKQIK